MWFIFAKLRFRPILFISNQCSPVVHLRQTPLHTNLIHFKSVLTCGSSSPNSPSDQSYSFQISAHLWFIFAKLPFRPILFISNQCSPVVHLRQTPLQTNVIHFKSVLTCGSSSPNSLQTNLIHFKSVLTCGSSSPYSPSDRSYKPSRR